MIKKTARFSFIPLWMVWLQCICFSVLYFIWALPGTILIRHLCLIIGGLIGLYEVYKYRNLFFKIRSVPTWFLMLLFIWMALHLFFLTNDFNLQFYELISIWKRAAIGAIFALGLGLCLAGMQTNNSQSKNIWILFYAGLISPVILYLIKYFLSIYGLKNGWQIPDYLRLYYRSAPYYLPKTVYICFCLPVLGVTLGQLSNNIQNHGFFRASHICYLAVTFSIFYIFYNENIKNGVIYGNFLLIFFIIKLISRNFKNYLYQKVAISIFIIGISGSFLLQHIANNRPWMTFVADARVVFAIEKSDAWRYGNITEYPRNENGEVVAITNYERMVWAKEGLSLLLENPLGYGLVERSFGHLEKIKWPKSSLSQSHSGWIDLTLGIGLPGIIMLLTAMLSVIYLSGKDGECPLKKGDHFVRDNAPWISLCWWTLFGTFLIWFTTELSQRIFFDVLIFWTAFGCGVLMMPKAKLV